MLSLTPQRMSLTVDGLGIVFYSPSFALSFQEGEDFLKKEYTHSASVQRYIQSGTIVGFGTGSPGNFELYFRSGYPSDSELSMSQFALRLGAKVTDGVLFFTDLLDLSQSTA